MFLRKITAVLLAVLICAGGTSCSQIGGFFSESSSEPESSVEESSEPEPEPETIQFPEGYSPDLTSWELTLVNSTHKLPDDFEIELSDVTVDANTGMRVDSRIIEQVNAMLADCRSYGCPLYITSSYRSLSFQQGLFNYNVEQLVAAGMTETEALEETRRNIATPGTSDHNLGLAIDVVTGDWYMYHDDLNESFEETPAFAWLSEHAWEYGFILRYPKDKQSITKINYEPWHYRYVGVENAKVIKDLGICLEEFWDIAEGKPVYVQTEEDKKPFSNLGGESSQAESEGSESAEPESAA
ncbi:MAG TPA: M15 family metallopeptidase [Firmicutes bacterium]|nr:M15 family metallopeptidase [Bacillota bacterium]